MEVSMRQGDRALADERTKKITTTDMALSTRLAATLCHRPQRPYSESSRDGKSQNIRSTNVISAPIKHLASSCLLPFQALLLSIIIFSLASSTKVMAGENNRQPSGGRLELHQPLGDSMNMMRSKRSPPQQQQPPQTSRQAIIPAANPNFEAAFQGECGKNNKNGNPCGHICLDLYDGTYECSCFYGFTLAVDGYSCTPVAELHANSSGPALLAASARSPKQPQSPAVEQAAASEQRREKATPVFAPNSAPIQEPSSTNSGQVSGPQAETSSRQPADVDVSFVAAYKSAHDEASDNNSLAKGSLGASEPRRASDLGRQPPPSPPPPLPPIARGRAAPDTISEPAANDNGKLATAAQIARGPESSSSNERGSKIIGGGGPDELLRPRQRRLLAASAWLQRRQRQQQESSSSVSAGPGVPRGHRGKEDGKSQRAITESGKPIVAAAATTTAAATTLDNNKGNDAAPGGGLLDSLYYAPAEGLLATPGELIELSSSDDDLVGLDADIKSIMLANDQLLERLAALVAATDAAGPQETDGARGSAPDHRRLRRQQDMALLELFVNKTMEDYLEDTSELELAGAESNQPARAPNQSSRPSDSMADAASAIGRAKTPGKALLLCSPSSAGTSREECGRGRGRSECEWGGQCLAEKRWISLAAQNLVAEHRVSRCQCPIGRGGHLCQKPAQRVVPKFMGKSYLALPMATDRPELVELRLVFRPLEEGGEGQQPLPSLLLYSQKFILLLDSMNRVELRYSSGAQVTRVYGSRDVLMGAWNELVVTPDASNDDNRGADRVVRPAHLEVLGEEGARLVAPIDNRIVLVTPDRIQLDTGGELANYSTELFVAGLPDQSRGRRRRRRRRPNKEEDEEDEADDGIINGVEGLGAARGLRGCVGELSINGRRYKFNSDLNGDALDGFDIAECCEATLGASA